MLSVDGGAFMTFLKLILCVCIYVYVCSPYTCDSRESGLQQLICAVHHMDRIELGTSALEARGFTLSHLACLPLGLKGFIYLHSTSLEPMAVNFNALGKPD